MKYVGIDIGDGESAVTIVSRDGVLIPTVVPLKNTKSIRSIVGKLNGDPIIGDAVVLNHAVTNRSARFKSRFLYDTKASEDLELFAKGLYEILTQTLHDDDLKIALGCPAAWKQEARERYAQTVMRAGFPTLYTVSESRAAFLYAHYCNELGISAELLSRPTLVIDIGSSTIDYAYIVDGKERDVGVFGEEQLGGGMLDELILDYAVEQSPDKKKIREIFKTVPSWKSYCELIARKLKEQYFLNEERWAEKSCSDVAPIYMDEHTLLSLTISISGTIMQTLLKRGIDSLNHRSFLQALQDTLKRAKEMTSEHVPELLIVTGGASRMQFFQDACRKTFPHAQLALCNEPEFSIARGLGIAARTDHILSQFRAEISEYFKSGVVEQEIQLHMPHLLPNYVPKAAELLEQHGVLDAITNYKGNVRNASQFHAYVKDKIGNVLQNQDMMKDADHIINVWIEKHLTRVQEDLDNICDRYQIDRADMSLLKIRAEIKLNQIHIPLSIRVFAVLQQTWGLRKVSRVVRDLMQFLSNGNSIMARRLRRQLNAELSDPNGVFAKMLAEHLVRDLQEQIDAQTKKVEIQIS